MMDSPLADRAEAERAWGALLAYNGTDTVGNGPILLGAPTEVADALRPFVTELGFETVIVRMLGPYDRETIDLMAEVRELLDG